MPRRQSPHDENVNRGRSFDRWCVEWYDATGRRDRDVREVADSPEQALATIRRLLAGQSVPNLSRAGKALLTEAWQAARLRQSILNHALEGKLVPIRVLLIGVGC